MAIIKGVLINSSFYSKGKKEDQETKTIDREFYALNLSLSNLMADITIEPGASDKIEVKLTATQTMIDNIEFRHKGNEVQISAKTPRGSYFQKGTNVLNIRNGVFYGDVVGGDKIVIQNGNIVSQGSNTYISDNGNGSRAQLVIKMPCGNRITVDGVKGNVNIGKLHCDLRVDISGASMIRAETVGDLNAEVSGSSNISVGCVNGDADCEISGCGNISIGYISGDANYDISGSGKIIVSSGCINKLRVGISGSGNAQIMATAKAAKFSASGAGNIYVKHVLIQPQIKCSGMGCVRVDSVG